MKGKALLSPNLKAGPQNHQEVGSPGRSSAGTASPNTTSMETCWRCGEPCTPVLYVWSERKKKALPMCNRCWDEWAENGDMPE